MVSQSLSSLVKYENPVLVSSSRDKKLKGKTGAKGEYYLNLSLL